MFKDLPSFFRKGEVGDHVNFMTDEESALVDTRCKEVKDKYGLVFN